MRLTYLSLVVPTGTGPAGLETRLPDGSPIDSGWTGNPPPSGRVDCSIRSTRALEAVAGDAERTTLASRAASGSEAVTGTRGRKWQGNEAGPRSGHDLDRALGCFARYLNCSPLRCCRAVPRGGPGLTSAESVSLFAGHSGWIPVFTDSPEGRYSCFFCQGRGCFTWNSAIFEKDRQIYKCAPLVILESRRRLHYPRRSSSLSRLWRQGRSASGRGSPSLRSSRSRYLPRP